MYKVFIENRIVIFAKSNSKIESSAKLSAKTIKSLENLVEKLDSFDPTEIVWLTAVNPEKEMERLFSDFIHIDAAGGLVKRKQKYLLIKRNGIWDIPKGKVEENESIENAAIREVEEECGISGVEIIVPLMVTYHTYVFRKEKVLKKTTWFKMEYSGKKELIVQAEEGITKAKWCKKEKVVELGKRSYASIQDVIETYFLTEEK